MYYVYRFLDKSQNVIYVGKSKQDLEIRFAGHLHLPKECYSMVRSDNISLISSIKNMNREERFAERTFTRQARNPQTKLYFEMQDTVSFLTNRR